VAAGVPGRFRVLKREGAGEPGLGGHVEGLLEVLLGLAREATMMSVVIAASGSRPGLVDDARYFSLRYCAHRLSTGRSGRRA